MLAANSRDGLAEMLGRWAAVDCFFAAFVLALGAASLAYTLFLAPLAKRHRSDAAACFAWAVRALRVRSFTFWQFVFGLTLVAPMPPFFRLAIVICCAIEFHRRSRTLGAMARLELEDVRCVKLREGVLFKWIVCLPLALILVPTFVVLFIYGALGAENREFVLSAIASRAVWLLPCIPALAAWRLTFVLNRRVDRWFNESAKPDFWQRRADAAEAVRHEKLWEQERPFMEAREAVLRLRPKSQMPPAWRRYFAAWERAGVRRILPPADQAKMEMTPTGYLKTAEAHLRRLKLLAFARYPSLAPGEEDALGALSAALDAAVADGEILSSQLGLVSGLDELIRLFETPWREMPDDRQGRFEFRHRLEVILFRDPDETDEPDEDLFEWAAEDLPPGTGSWDELDKSGLVHEVRDFAVRCYEKFPHPDAKILRRTQTSTVEVLTEIKHCFFRAAVDEQRAWRERTRREARGGSAHPFEAETS